MSNKILIVDSNEEAQILYREKFKDKYDFIFSIDGEDAEKKVKSDLGIDLIITEIGLRKVDGITLIKNLSNYITYQKIIVVSFYGDMSNIRLAMNAGAYDFIIKPINFEDLEETINRTLERIKIAKTNLQNNKRLDFINAELNTTAELQKSILPGNEFKKDCISIYANTIPANEVGGDFYDFFVIDEDKIGIVIADVSGKNVSASIFMTMSKTLIKSFSKYFKDPLECIKKVNESLCADNKMNMFVTCIYGVFYIREKMFRFVNAGHLAPRVVLENGYPMVLKVENNCALGVFEEEYKAREYKFKKSGYMLFYTDGVVEAINVKNEEYEYYRLDEVLSKNKSNSPKDIVNAVYDSINKFVEDAKQFDDITMLCVKIDI